MNQSHSAPLITLRIPGNWSDPRKLIQALPEGFRLGPESLRMPDGTEVEFNPLPPDGQFPGIFKSSCRRPARDDELAVVNQYTVNIALSGPGGSFEAALVMMQAGASIVRAGAAGVFIDNSAVAHWGSDWMEMTDAGTPDAIMFAFVSVIRGQREIYTAGLHTLGFPDLLMQPDRDCDEPGNSIMDLAMIMPISVGSVVADRHGVQYTGVSMTSDEFPGDSPVHNPYGRLKLVSTREIAAGN